MNKQTIIIALLALVAMAGQAQVKVTGHVVNERGETVEYVSIGIEEDSVGVISDAQGHFTLTIPAIAVGTGTWGIAAVIPKYLSLRLQPERFVPLYPRKLAFTINLMLKTTKNILNLEDFP